MIGAFGGCYAVRSACYHPAPRAFIVDDFFISMAVLQDGYQAINELAAVCHEDVSDQLPEEFRRKARISAGNFQNLVAFRRLLWPPWQGRSFAYWSHKVLRWLTPLLLVLLLLSSVVLVAQGGGWLYQVLLLGQLGLPLLVGLDALLHSPGRASAPAALRIPFLRHERGPAAGPVAFSGGRKNHCLGAHTAVSGEEVK